MKTLFTTIGLVLLASFGFANTLDLTWSTVDGGGGTSTGGLFTMSATIGQPDAGTLSGGTFVLTGGFWHAEAAPCPADLTGDGFVDLSDLAVLLAHYGESGAPASDGDLNGDGNVDLSDLAALIAHYGTTCP